MTDEGVTLSSIITRAPKILECAGPITFYFFEILGWLLGVTLNSLIIYSNLTLAYDFMFHNSVQSTSDVYMVSMACADLLIGLLVIPFSKSSQSTESWVFGNAWCNIWIIITIWSSASLIYSLCGLVYDRLLAVKNPIDYNEESTIERIKRDLRLIWLFPLVIIVPPYLLAFDFNALQLDPDSNQRTIRRLYQFAAFVEKHIFLRNEESFVEVPAFEPTHIHICPRTCQLTNNAMFIMNYVVMGFSSPIIFMIYGSCTIYSRVSVVNKANKRGYLTAKGTGGKSDELMIRMHRGGAKAKHQTTTVARPPRATGPLTTTAEIEGRAVRRTTGKKRPPSPPTLQAGGRIYRTVSRYADEISKGESLNDPTRIYDWEGVIRSPIGPPDESPFGIKRCVASTSDGRTGTLTHEILEIEGIPDEEETPPPTGWRRIIWRVHTWMEKLLCWVEDFDKEVDPQEQEYDNEEYEYYGQDQEEDLVENQREDQEGQGGQGDQEKDKEEAICVAEMEPSEPAALNAEPGRSNYHRSQVRNRIQRCPSADLLEEDTTQSRPSRILAWLKIKFRWVARVKEFLKPSRAAVTLSLIIILLPICYGPLFVTHMIRTVCYDCVGYYMVRTVYWIGYSNSFFAPLIYAVMSRKYRLTVTDFIRKMLFMKTKRRPRLPGRGFYV